MSFQTSGFNANKDNYLSSTEGHKFHDLSGIEGEVSNANTPMPMLQTNNEMLLQMKEELNQIKQMMKNVVSPETEFNQRDVTSLSMPHNLEIKDIKGKKDLTKQFNKFGRDGEE